MALAALGSDQFAGSGQAESLGGGLMRFEFVLLYFALLCHPFPTASHENRRAANCPVGDKIPSLGPAYFFAGARTMNMVRPSMRGACSITPTSDNSSAICFKSSSAISG